MKPEQTVMKIKTLFVKSENLPALIAHHFGKISCGLNIVDFLPKKQQDRN
jgi:hypothetical protein